MCGGCGSPPPSADWYDAGVEDSARGRSQALLRLAEAAGLLCGSTGIRIQAQQSSRSLLIRTPTGRSEIVQQFGLLVPALETLAGRRMNPLDRK